MNKSVFSYYVRWQRDTARIHRRCCAPCSNRSISPAGRVSGKAVAYVETDRRTVHQCLNGRAPHNRIYRSTASRSPVLTRAGICVPPTVTYLPYSVSGSTLTAVGRSQLLARWPGTHSRILSGIRRAAQTVLGVYLKRTCSRVTSASSALGVLNDYALYKSTHSLTHIYHLRHLQTMTAMTIATTIRTAAPATLGMITISRFSAFSTVTRHNSHDLCDFVILFNIITRDSVAA